MASTTSESSECCTSPGMDAIGTGSAIPSRTKRGRPGRPARDGPRRPADAGPACGAAGAGAARGSRPQQGSRSPRPKPSVQPTGRRRPRVPGPRSARRRCPGPRQPGPRVRCRARPPGPPRQWSARGRRRAVAGKRPAIRGAQGHERVHARGGGERQRVGPATMSSSAGSGCGTHGAIRLHDVHLPTLAGRAPSGTVAGARSALGNRTRREPMRPRSGNASTSPRALCSAGTRSGSTPVRRSASAVAGPTAATSTEPRARASRSDAHEALHRGDRRQDDPVVSPAGTAAAAARSAAPPSAGST